MTILVALVGQKRVGKDTFADIFIEQAENFFNKEDIMRASLAAPIKSGLAELLQLPKETFTDDDLKERVHPELGFTPRHLLQWLGTDIFREKFGKDVWLETLERQLRMQRPELAIVTDVRFQNELDYMKRMGAYIIQIHRDTGLSDTHESEKGLLTDSEFQIWNDSGVGEYHQKCKLMSEVVLARIKYDLLKDKAPQEWTIASTYDSPFFKSKSVT